MKPYLIIYLFLTLLVRHTYAQPNQENIELSIDYIIINSDTTFFNPKKILPYKSNKELRNEKYVELITYKETTIVTSYKFRHKNNIISRIDIEFHLIIDGKLYRRLWGSMTLYSSDPEKQKLIDEKREHRWVNPVEIMEPFIQNSLNNKTSIESAKIKVTYTLKE